MSFTIYPAIDLRGGKVVRLQEGDPERMTAYSEDPATTARRWLADGASWLHVVNLDGAFGEKDDANHSALKLILNVAKEAGARLQFGGGMRSLPAIEQAFDMGVSRVVLGTIAIEEPTVVAEAIEKFDRERVAVGIDARDGLVRLRGWKENSGVPATELSLHMRSFGLRTIIFTDVSRDGLGHGLNISATKALADVSGLEVIASGGVYMLEDVLKARDADLAGVIIGRALYDKTVDLKSLLETIKP